MSFFNNKYFQGALLILLGITPIVLWFLPIYFFDEGTIALCFSKRFFGIECLGCGMTRAVMHFHHLDFATAYAFNKLVVVIYPILVGLWLKWIKGAVDYFRIERIVRTDTEDYSTTDKPF